MFKEGDPVALIETNEDGTIDIKLLNNINVVTDKKVYVHKMSLAFNLDGTPSFNSKGNMKLVHFNQDFLNSLYDNGDFDRMANTVKGVCNMFKTAENEDVVRYYVALPNLLKEKIVV